MTDNYAPHVCEERCRRILLSVYAYAYEFESDSLVSDAEYDEMSALIDTSIRTGNDKIDDFFAKEFSPSTGMWIRKHPELHKVKLMYHRRRIRGALTTFKKEKTS